MAGADTPMPYVVLSINPGSKIHGSSASQRGILNEEWQIPVSFSVFANTKPTTANLGERLARAFDRAYLNSGARDRQIVIERGADTLHRVGDAEYVCEINYTLRLDRLFG